KFHAMSSSLGVRGILILAHRSWRAARGKGRLPAFLSAGILRESQVKAAVVFDHHFTAFVDAHHRSFDDPCAAVFQFRMERVESAHPNVRVQAKTRASRV